MAVGGPGGGTGGTPRSRRAAKAAVSAAQARQALVARSAAMQAAGYGKPKAQPKRQTTRPPSVQRATRSSNGALPKNTGVAPHPTLNPRDVHALGGISRRANPLLQHAIGNLMQDAYYAPGGLYHTAAAPVSDLKHGDLTFPRSRKLAKQIGVATYETARHPERRPGDTALLAFAAASAGAGAAAKAGTVGRALQAGDLAGAAKAAITRSAPGEINLPGGVQALEPDNPLLRPIARRRAKAVTKNIENGERGRGVSSAQGVVGRELRAREQVQADVAQAPIAALAHMAKKLTPEEHTALRVRAIEGRLAKTHPAETVARHAETHDRYAAEARQKAADLEASGGTPAQIRRAREEVILNEEAARDLRKPGVVKALAEPRQEFRRVVTQARLVSRRSEQELVSGERLSAAGGDVRRAKIAGEYGNPHGAAGTAPTGSFYFPTGERFKTPAGGIGKVITARRATPHGVPPVTPSRYLGGTLNEFTGKGLRHGVVGKPGEAVAARATGTARLASAERMQQALLKLGTPERVSDNQVLIRKGPIDDQTRRAVAAAVEEAKSGDQTALVRAHKRIEELLAPGEGDPGVYVDRRYIKELPMPSGSKVARAAAKVTKPFRFFGVYLTPKYLLLNRPQNFLMRQMMQRGLPHTHLKGRVSQMRETLGDNVTAVYDGMGGEGRTVSYLPHESRISEGEQWVTQQIMEKTDRDERFLSVIARAAQKGYKTEADLRRLALSKDPKVENDRVAIARRARKDLVDFTVTPAERELSDFFYFYPWLSRGSVWAGRWLLNRPGQAEIAAQVAAVGRRDQRQKIGDVPRWMQSYAPVGHGLSNLAPLFTPSTPAQLIDTFAHPNAPGTQSIAQALGTPPVQLLSTPIKDWPRDIKSSFGPLSLAQAAGALGSPAKTFPDRGPLQAAERFVGGTVIPRNPDLAQVHKQAAKEQRAAMSPTDRAIDDGRKKRNVLIAGARNHGLLAPGEELSQPVKDALRYWTARRVNYARAGAKNQTDMYLADVKQLIRRGVLQPGFLPTAQQLAAGTLVIDGKPIGKERALVEIKKARDYFTRNYYGGKTLDDVHAQIKARAANGG